VPLPFSMMLPVLRAAFAPCFPTEDLQSLSWVHQFIKAPQTHNSSDWGGGLCLYHYRVWVVFSKVYTDFRSHHRAVSYMQHYLQLKYKKDRSYWGQPNGFSLADAVDVEGSVGGAWPLLGSDILQTCTNHTASANNRKSISWDTPCDACFKCVESGCPPTLGGYREGPNTRIYMWLPTTNPLHGNCTIESQHSKIETRAMKALSMQCISQSASLGLITCRLESAPANAFLADFRYSEPPVYQVFQQQRPYLLDQSWVSFSWRPPNFEECSMFTGKPLPNPDV
jgi:hypothetical protein